MFVSIGLLGFIAYQTNAGSPTLPSRHVISNVVWHKQMNGLFCGPGSLEIVFDYWGPDIEQKAIADVARSSSMGTWCYDIQRAGHFSALSAAQGRFFPTEAPVAGFAERGLGYASFAHAAATIWLDELKALLASDIPVILLMYFAPDGTGGGHYRVAVGYDDALGMLYFSDPWGRDSNRFSDVPGTVVWSYAEVASGWNYVAYGTPLPFYGVAILPWGVQVSVKGKAEVGRAVTITAAIGYPCPDPFDVGEFPAEGATATVTVPAGLTLLGPATVSLGTMNAGAVRTVSWKAQVDTIVPGGSIAVRAQGLVSGSVPEARWEGEGVSYPPYSYTDCIGGDGSTQWP
jgi:hypothetical protein